jgi:hypothetical protein
LEAQVKAVNINGLLQGITIFIQLIFVQWIPSGRAERCGLCAVHGVKP